MRVPAGGAVGPVLEVAHHVHPSRKVLWTRCTCHLASAVTSRGPPHTRSGFEANLRGDFHHKYFSTCLFQRKGIPAGEKQATETLSTRSGDLLLCKEPLQNGVAWSSDSQLSLLFCRQSELPWGSPQAAVRSGPCGGPIRWCSADAAGPRPFHTTSAGSRQLDSKSKCSETPVGKSLCEPPGSAGNQTTAAFHWSSPRQAGPGLSRELDFTSLNAEKSKGVSL